MEPIGLKWRSHPAFILTTVGVALFSDLFLFALIVPILPFILEDRLGTPPSQVQTRISALLTAFSCASVILSPFIGWAADKMQSRRSLYLFGVLLLTAATALMFSARTFPLLILSRVIQGASGSIVWVMGMALCCETVGEEHLGKAIGTVLSFVILGPLFAPPLGGTIYQFAGLNAVGALAASVLALDLILRLLIIEKCSAAEFNPRAVDSPPDHQRTSQFASSEERTPLLANGGNFNGLTITPRQSYLFQKVPLLYCLGTPSMIVSLAVVFSEAVFFSAFDATVPLHAHELFGFNALKSGLMMMPIGIMTVLVGPLAGWAVDRVGPKPLAVGGFSFAAVGMPLLAIPTSGTSSIHLALYVGSLSLCGVALAMLDTPAMVESLLLVERFRKANPGLFDNKGPYAQHNAIVYTFFSLGMSTGPVISGMLKSFCGYANMTIFMGGVAALMAIISLIWLGGPIKKRSADNVLPNA